MSQRLEFVTLAQHPAANVRELCRRYGVHPDTGYKWIARFKAGGAAALADRSRRPRVNPGRTSEDVERAVLTLRRQHPAWGGRKIRRRLLSWGLSAPAASTVGSILRRHGLVDEQHESPKHVPFVRFEHAAPNDLWQMDYKGHFPTESAAVDGMRCLRCHPLAVLDDHSRFNVLLRACADELASTVMQALTGAFRTYGLPRRILSDNGAPWGNLSGQGTRQRTKLEVWLLRLGVEVTHGRAYHPQTQGKQERFHRTLAAEVIGHGERAWRDLDHCQRAFDDWREVYNLLRPHEALPDMATPAQRYTPSPRAFPETLPPIEYGPGDIVRRVQDKGQVSYRGRAWPIGSAFAGLAVALRPCIEVDGVMDVFFCTHHITSIDLRCEAIAEVR